MCEQQAFGMITGRRIIRRLKVPTASQDMLMALQKVWECFEQKYQGQRWVRTGSSSSGRSYGPAEPDQCGGYLG